MRFKITGLDSLQRQLDHATEALETLQGEIATLKFNPDDPTSVETAIIEMEQTIDSKISSYRGNVLVEQVAAQLKNEYKNKILQRADEAQKRSEVAVSGDNRIDQTILRQIENTINDLRRAEYNTYSRHAKKLSRLLHSPGLEEITRKLTNGIDLDAWLATGAATQGSMIGSASLEWPSDIEKELGTVILLADRFAESMDEAFNFAHTFYHNGNSVTSNLQNMVGQMFVPFARDYIDYIKVATGSSEATLFPTRIGPAARKVFVVHGHDEGAREAVARFLERLGFGAIVLHEQANQGRTVIEKIEAHGDVGFAVVLLTPDDMGCLNGETPQPRARQNALLELGYFVGRLGRSRVCALVRDGVEVPSDFGGVFMKRMMKAAVGNLLWVVNCRLPVSTSTGM